MPRIIAVTLASEKTGPLIEQIQTLKNVVGISLQRDGSLDPPGDIVTIATNNEGVRNLFKVFDELNVLDGGSITTSEPRSLISRPHQDNIDTETNETVWDEMASLLRQDTNLSGNFLMLMALAGAVAAAGLWTNTVHVVIGAMLIAPGFEPLLRIPFGFIGGPRALAARGLIASLSGYACLALGAGLTFLLLRAVDASQSSDLHTRSWVEYWSHITPTGVLVALVGGVTGAVVITTQRSTLTAGVMIALALIPTMALAGMAGIIGDWELAGRAFVLWAVNVVAVLAASGATFGLKQLLIHRGKVLSETR